MKFKVKVNDSFITIINFITSSSEVLSYFDVLQHCLDYDCYREYYINYHIFKDLIDEHNLDIIHQNKKNNIFD